MMACNNHVGKSNDMDNWGLELDDLITKSQAKKKKIVVEHGRISPADHSGQHRTAKVALQS